MKTRTRKESFFQWLDHLEETGRISHGMIHLGEYYLYLYPTRKFQTQGSRATTGFTVWLKAYWVKEYSGKDHKPFEQWISEWCKPRGYVWGQHPDWHGEGFLFDFKKVKTLDQYQG